MYTNENELDTRENLIRYFTRYLGIELGKVNPAFRFSRIESPILVSEKTLRNTTALGAYAAIRDLLNPKIGPKLKLPVVIWQHGKTFKKSIERYTLEYQVLFSKTTAFQYLPSIVRCCEIMLRKQCGKIFTADQDASGISIFAHDTDLEMARIQERFDFSSGKNIELVFFMDTITIVNIQHEFGKIRRAAPLDKK